MNYKILVFILLIISAFILGIKFKTIKNYFKEISCTSKYFKNINIVVKLIKKELNVLFTEYKNRLIEEVFIYVSAITVLHVLRYDKENYKYLYDRVKRLFVKGEHYRETVFVNRLLNYIKLFKTNWKELDKTYVKNCYDYQIYLFYSILEKQEYAKIDVEKDSLRVNPHYIQMLSMTLFLRTQKILISYIDFLKENKKRKFEFKNKPFSINDIIKMSDFKLDPGYYLTEQTLYYVDSTQHRYMSVVFVSDDKKPINFNLDKILDNVGNRIFFKYINCDISKLYEYFMFQLRINDYLNSDDLSIRRTFVFERNIAMNYKKLLQETDCPKEYKEFTNYPVIIQDNNCLHVGLFSKNIRGINFDIIKVEPRMFYQFEDSYLVKKLSDIVI